MLKISKYKLPQNRAGNHAGSSPAVGTIKELDELNNS